jgi:hypothetical protein
MPRSVATAKIGSFHLMSARAILAKCLGTAYPRATAPSGRVRGRGLAARSNTTSSPGAFWTTGPRACRSQMPGSTFLKRGSVIFSTNCSGRLDDVRSLPK